MSLELFAGCKTQADVTKRYRELAKKCHPDKGGSTETMQALNEIRALACQSLPIPTAEETASRQYHGADWASEYSNFVTVTVRRNGFVVFTDSA